MVVGREECGLDVEQLVVAPIGCTWHLTTEEYATAPPYKELTRFLSGFSSFLIRELVEAKIEFGIDDPKECMLDTVNRMWLRDEAERIVGVDTRCADCPLQEFEPVEEVSVEEEAAEAIRYVTAVLEGNVIPIDNLRVNSIEPSPAEFAAAACRIRKARDGCSIQLQIQTEIHRLQQSGASVVKAYLMQQEQMPRWRRDNSYWVE